MAHVRAFLHDCQDPVSERDLPVERHRPDAEFAAQLGTPTCRQRELPAARPSASPRGLDPRQTVRFAGSAPARPAPRRRRTRGGRPRSWCPGPASTRRPTPWADRSCTVLTKWVRFRPRRVDLSNLPAGRPGRRTRGRGRRVGRVEAGRPQAVALQVPSFRPKRSRAAAVGPRLDACGQQVRGAPRALGTCVGRSPPDRAPRSWLSPGLVAATTDRVPGWVPD